MCEQRPGKVRERAVWLSGGRVSEIGLQQVLISSLTSYVHQNQPASFTLKLPCLSVFPSFVQLSELYIDWVFKDLPPKQASRVIIQVKLLAQEKNLYLAEFIVRSGILLQFTSTVISGRIDWISVPKLSDPVNKEFKYSTVAVENTSDFTIGRKYYFLQELENQRYVLDNRIFKRTL